MGYTFRCARCGTEFTDAHGHRARRYCSHTCYVRSNTGDQNRSFKGGTVRKDGYRAVHVNGHKVLEHRYVMEQFLGRPLQPGEVVHHRDGNKLNNDINNLELQSSQADHRKAHYHRLCTDTQKECSRCGRVKSRSEFPLRARSAIRGLCDPHQPQCRDCTNALYRDRRRTYMAAYRKRQRSGSA